MQECKCCCRKLAGKEPSPSNELTRLAGNGEAKVRIADEARLRDLERKDLVGQIDARSAIMKVTKNELKFLREQIGDSETAMKENAEYVKMLEAAREQGNLRETTLQQARNELHAARARLHDLQVAVGQAERKLLELDQENKKVIIEADIQRYREIKELRKQLIDEEQTEASIEALLHGDSIMLSGNSDQVMLTIIRRAPSGFIQIAADSFSALQPGDILQVGGPVLPTDNASLTSLNH